MKSFIVAFLVLVAAAQAQPDLRVVLSNEFGPGFRGLIGQDIASFSTTYLTSNQLDWTSTLPPRDVPPGPYGYLIMRFPLDLVNVGRDAWRAGNAWTHPQHYRWLPFYGPTISDLVSITFSDARGNIVRERMLELALMWDVNPAIPGIPSSHSYYDVAIDGGFGASSGYDGMEYLTDSLVCLEGVPNGVYRMSIVIDPLNAYGIFDPAKNPTIWVSLNEAEVLPCAAPEEFPPTAKPTAATVKPVWIKPTTVRPPALPLQLK